MERIFDEDGVRDRHYQKFMKKRKPEDELDEADELKIKKKKPIKNKPIEDDPFED
jgi:hypothetical protein